jgi:hypothetical protein
MIFVVMQRFNRSRLLPLIERQRAMEARNKP